MKLKTLLILLVITTVLAGLSSLVLRPKSAQQSKIGAPLLPELPVNEIARLTLSSTEARVDLVKGSAVWQVENRFGYAADFDKISEFLRKFSKLKIGRSFEANTETLKRLQLIDPDQTDAGPGYTGIRILLTDTDGNALGTYILGSDRNTDSGSGGQYLRQAEAQTVYLVDESFRFLKKQPAEWLQQDLLDIKEAEVRQVVCYPAGADKEIFTVRRPEQGKPAALVELPKDRTADTTKIEQLMGALAPLKIKDIVAQRQEPAPAMGDGLHLTYSLFNGQQVHVFPRKVGDGDAARYELQTWVTYEAPAAEEAQDSDSANEDKANETAETPEEKIAETEPATPTPQEIQALTEDLAARMSGWTFLMEEWQWKSFITEVDGLLEEAQEDPPAPKT